jgi:hypothetical protein
MAQTPDQPGEELDPSTHQPLHLVTEDDDEVEVATAHRIDAIGGDIDAVDPVHHGGGIANPAL